MKIKLSSKTVAGTDRGGEDLFFVVRASSRVEPSPDVLKAEFEKAWEACVASIPKDPDAEDLWLDDEEVELEAADEPMLRSQMSSDCYDFQINWPLSEARKIVERVVLEGGWIKDLKTGKYKVRDKIFVDGNAE
jgi:hypothetical protein